MPQLNVLCWNIQTLGNLNNYRTRQSRTGMIARAVADAQADVLCIQELMQAAIAGLFLESLQDALNALPAPMNNWYYEWIHGALTNAARPVNHPHNTAADLMWDAAHNEGYAMFWNQNIAKFILQRAPDIQPPALGVAPPPPLPPAPPAVANTQSSGSKMAGVGAIGGGVAPMVGMAVPAGGIVVPPGGGNQYTLPAGSNEPGIGVIGAAANRAAGYTLPVGTIIGGGGLTLAAATNGVNPVVVPGGFVLTDALTLPAAGAVVVPEHALGLVMFGRDASNPLDPTRAPPTLTGDIAGATDDFAPGAANYWNWVWFTRGAGFPASQGGSRRPAYATIRVNRPGALAGADQLVPIMFYHAPSAATAARAGMQRASFGQPMYQAWDWTVPGWIDCNNALIGGDFNVRMDIGNYAYTSYTSPWGPAGWFGGGAGATMLVANPAPAVPPGSTMADNPLNKSIVALTNGVVGPKRFSAALNDFRSLAIDNIFYRGLGAVVPANSGIGDVMNACYGPALAVAGTMTGAALQNCVNVPNMVTTAQCYIMGRPCVFAALNQAFTSMRDIQQGRMGYYPNFSVQNTRARRTAEFVNLFVSDHLPVAIRFNM